MPKPVVMVAINTDQHCVDTSVTVLAIVQGGPSHTDDFDKQPSLEGEATPGDELMHHYSPEDEVECETERRRGQ